jgi:hypothetical protein
MRNRTLVAVAGAALTMAALTGCSLARSLTTEHKTFTYSIAMPPVPANVTEQGQLTLDEQVENTYSKYHGGVDWSCLGYQASNSSAIQPATVKLYASLSGSVASNQLDQQATLIQTITVNPSASQTVSIDQAPKDDALSSFLSQALSQHQVTTIYFYAAGSSADPSAVVNIQNFTARVQVHGSYF